jgi:hypothetical protein
MKAAAIATNAHRAILPIRISLTRALLETAFHFNILYIEVNKKIRPCEPSRREQRCPRTRQCSMGVLFGHNAP